MAELTYTTIASLDGYVVDEHGRFDWAEPDEEVHAAVNDLERGVGTHLYGRRLYEVMTVWDTWDTTGEPAVIRDYAAIWQAAEKVVYSTTLEDVASRRTRIERTFVPAQVEALKAAASADLSVGGPTLAAHALRAGLVDRCHLFVVPVVVGGGTRVFPDGVRTGLRLLDQRRFTGGVVHLHYRVGT